MSKLVKNKINSYAFDKVTDIISKEKHVTPRILDSWELALHSELKLTAHIGKSRIREMMVGYILSEFGVTVFGIKPAIDYDPSISEKMIKKMKSQRKKGFCDTKMVKAALK